MLTSQTGNNYPEIGARHAGKMAIFSFKHSGKGRGCCGYALTRIGQKKDVYMQNLIARKWRSRND